MISHPAFSFMSYNGTVKKKKKQQKLLLEFIKWDLRSIIAAILGLVVLIGIGLAATGDELLYTFDFGTASSADVATGAIQVTGGGSIYPRGSGNVRFGWVTTGVQEFSRGAEVADKLLRDFNTSSSGVSQFRLSGLESGTYNFKFHVGDSTNKISTLIKVQGRQAVITRTGDWGTVELPVVVDGSSQLINIDFTSGASDAIWAINALQIYKSAAVAAQPTFNVSVTPTSHTITAGSTAVYAIGVTPMNNYGSGVDLSITGLVAGMQAEFIPPTITSLPGTAELRLSTSASTAPTSYEFAVRVRGRDPDVVTKTVIVQLQVRAGQQTSTDPNAPDSGGVVNPDGSITPTGSQVPGDVRSLDEIEEDFSLIDQYVAAEAQKIVTRTNMNELTGISHDTSAFPVLSELPEPKTAVERSLQFLTRNGIIESTYDTAPRGQEDVGKKGLWQKFLGTFVTNAG